MMQEFGWTERELYEEVTLRRFAQCNLFLSYRQKAQEERERRQAGGAHSGGAPRSSAAPGTPEAGITMRAKHKKPRVRVIK
jgi:hypothetical protein